MPYLTLHSPLSRLNAEIQEISPKYIGENNMHFQKKDWQSLRVKGRIELKEFPRHERKNDRRRCNGYTQGWKILWRPE